MANNVIINNKNVALAGSNDGEYSLLVSQISNLWKEAKAKSVIAVNTELLDANWHTGKYIVEFEQGGYAKAKYGDK